MNACGTEEETTEPVATNMVTAGEQVTMPMMPLSPVGGEAPVAGETPVVGGEVQMAGEMPVAGEMPAAGEMPVAGEMPGQVANTLAKIPNVGLIEVELVWEPAWTKDRMSEDAKLALDIY